MIRHKNILAGKKKKGDEKVNPPRKSQPGEKTVNPRDWSTN